MYIFIALAVWIVYELIFFLLHIRPLSEKEIKKLSTKRKRKYIRKNYNFSIKHATVNPSFKSAMNPKGALYRVNMPLNSFPAYVSLLLKGKKHEWIVFALEGNSTVKSFWANKGQDKNSVSFNKNIEKLISLCKKSDCYTIMCFHNHPNSNPNKYNCLLPSEQDIKTAKELAEIMNKRGVNLIEFVCERGQYLKYYESYSETFVPLVAAIETIKASNGKSKMKNYKLHRELGLIFRF